MGKETLQDLKKQLFDLRMQAILYNCEHRENSAELAVAIKKVKKNIAIEMVNERKGEIKNGKY